MHNLTFGTLYSGSSGNCVYIHYNNTRILIDVGKGPRVMARSLGEVDCTPADIDAIFVTHEHGDHIGGVARLADKPNIPVHLPEKCAHRLECLPISAMLHPPKFEVEVGEDGVRVSSFVTPHDSKMSVGYIIETPTVRLGVATDLGHLTREVVTALAGCDSVIIESNYDPHMLETGAYPAFLKRRIAADTGHLSNEMSAILAAVLVNSGTQNIMLAHLSQDNNTPTRALECTMEELVKRNLRANVKVAARHTATLFGAGNDIC